MNNIMLRVSLVLTLLFTCSLSLQAKETGKEVKSNKKEIKKEEIKKEEIKTTEGVVKDVSSKKETETSAEPQPQSTSKVSGTINNLLQQYENVVVQDSIQLNWYVFPGGISMGTGGELQLAAISGQNFVGTYTSSEYNLDLGFFQKFSENSCCIGYRGNVSEGYVDDGSPYSLNIADLVRLTAFMLAGDPPPSCLAEADIDGSGQIDISDVVHMVDFMFRGGPLPGLCP